MELSDPVVGLGLPRQVRSVYLQERWAYLAAFAALAIVTYAMWMPFGWRVSGTFEEWGIMTGADQQGILAMLYVPGSHRPLYIAPWVLAHWLTPGSFLGLNVIQAALLFGKSAALFWLVRRLVPGNSALAFVSATLLLVYPADDATYTLRTTNLHAGAFFLLVSVCLLVQALARFSWPTVIAMTAVQAIGLATYDGGLLLMFCGPAFIWWLRPVYTKRFVLLSLTWLAVPTWFLFLLVRTLHNPNSYQASLIRLSGLDGNYLGVAGSWAVSIFRALARTFLTGWAQTSALRVAEDPFLHLALALTLFVFVPVAWALTPNDRQIVPLRAIRKYWMLAMIGVVIVVAGFAMYLPTAWRNSNWRVFIYSSIGASLSVAVGCWIVSSLFRSSARLAFVAFSSMFVLVGTIHALNQHNEYYAFGQRQQTVLAGIVKAAPRIIPPVNLLLIDTTPPSAFEAWVMCTVISDCLQSQLQYVYHRGGFRAAYCAPGSRPRGRFSEECEFGEAGVTVSYNHLESKQPMQVFLPYESLLVFENTMQGVKLLSNINDYTAGAGRMKYNAGAHVDRNADPPARALTLFTRWPFKAEDLRRRMLESFRFEFDSPVSGSGWSIPEGSLMWTSAAESTLDVWLRGGVTYDVRFRVLRAMAPDILSSLRLTVNGIPVALVTTRDAEGGTTFSGTIAARAVDADPANTRLVFAVNRVVTPRSLGINDDERTLGLRFDWIRIDRQSAR
jgi:hypothetical protein